MKRYAKGFLIAASLFTLTTSAFAGDWGYDGQTGVYTPDDWGQVAEECGVGMEQSPINIVTGDVVPVHSVFIDYDIKKPKSFELTNNGYTVVAVPGSRSINISDGHGGAEKYSLIQFHFHAVSEHTINGEYYDMEVHFVHANNAFLSCDPAGKLAVLGVFMKVGKENEILKKLFNNLPDAENGIVAAANVNSNYKKLFPAGKNQKVYTYDGSLTTPGCQEIVTWFVFEKPIELSQEQLDDYRSLYQEDGVEYDTSRPVQPLNGRSVFYGEITKELSR